MKICSKCKRRLFEKDFHYTRRKYGDKTYVYRHAKCKDCRNEDKREWNAKNVAKIAFYNGDYYQNKITKGMVTNERVSGSNKQTSSQGGVVR